MSNELIAGRELDAMIAEKVMGWTRVSLFERVLDPAFFTGNAPHMYGDGTPADWLVPEGTDTSNGVGVREQVGELRIATALPAYSTSIADAWLVVEKMRELGTQFALMGHFSMEYPWCARFPDGPDNPRSHEQNFAETAPLAICIASLAALSARAVETEK